MGIAGVVGRFGEGMRAVETVRERDVDIVHDLFTGFPRLDSKGIRVRMQGVAKKQRDNLR